MLLNLESLIFKRWIFYLITNTCFILLHWTQERIPSISGNGQQSRRQITQYKYNFTGPKQLLNGTHEWLSCYRRPFIWMSFSLAPKQTLFCNPQNGSPDSAWSVLNNWRSYLSKSTLQEWWTFIIVPKYEQFSYFTFNG